MLSDNTGRTNGESAQKAEVFQVSLFGEGADASMAEVLEGSPQLGALAYHEILARRRKTLQVSNVFTHLEDNKLRRADYFAYYDLYALQLQALQIVVDGMTFLEGGVSRAVLAQRIEEVARAMAPERDPLEHQEVANMLVKWLVEAEDESVFRPTYVNVRPDGVVEQLQAAIEILRERQEPDGNLVLRASVEAINVLLGFLSDEIASAQRAEERMLDDSLKAGKVDAARRTAHHAWLRSIQLAEQVNDYIMRAKQDLTKIDWAGSVLEALVEMRVHVEERLEAEARMSDRAQEMRSDLGDSPKVEPLLDILEHIKECRRRHSILQSLLMDAGPTFREEQERQRFVRPIGVAHISMRQLLEKALCLRLSEPVDRVPTERFFRSLVGPTIRPVLDLGRLVDELCAPVREQTQTAPPLPTPVLVETAPAVRFPSETIETVERLLGSLPSGSPCRLSALFKQTRRLPEDQAHLAAELLRFRALAAFGPESRRDAADSAPMFAETDGHELRDPEYGGDDLLLFVGDAPLAERSDEQANRLRIS